MRLSYARLSRARLSHAYPAALLLAGLVVGVPAAVAVAAVATAAVVTAQPPAPAAARATSDAAQGRETKLPTVLFICPHGAAKSVLASAYFRQLAAERGIRVQIDAVGTEPGAEIGPAVAARLKEQRLAVPIARPRHVTPDDVARADIVVSIGCDVSRIPATSKLRRWDDVPNISDNFDAADKALRARAQALVDEISRAR